MAYNWFIYLDKKLLKQTFITHIAQYLKPVILPIDQLLISR